MVWLKNPFKHAKAQSKRLLKIIEGKNVMKLNTIISRYLLHYSVMLQSITGKSLAEMLFNCKLNMQLDLLKQSMNKQDLNYEH